MTDRISGLHHITAITADAQKNVDFYCGVLGLRLVKLTVNFDDPKSYHLYYGDELGRPGSIMTFFAWPGAPRGRQGPPQATVTSFSVPADSLGYWRKRLAASGTDIGEPLARFGDSVLEFSDPDGLRLELATPGGPDPRSPWQNGPVPPEHAIRGFHGVTLAEEGYEDTAALVTGTMGFRQVASEGNRFRYAGADGVPGGVVDLLCTPDSPRGSTGAGTVHHVAFRAADDESQKGWRERLVKDHHNVSPVMDRTYFHSIYFREPGGVLFEIATDSPGFAVDEPPESLGTALKLPAQYERARSAIEAILPRLRLPKEGKP
jgi:catechol 2,3-dioxygenase-like lactoylglutathione lyase family enzyme